MLENRTVKEAKLRFSKAAIELYFATDELDVLFKKRAYQRALNNLVKMEKKPDARSG